MLCRADVSENEAARRMQRFSSTRIPYASLPKAHIVSGGLRVNYHANHGIDTHKFSV
jgi:hypothetical protein